MEFFELKKVIDPHSNLPEEIKDLLWAAYPENRNDSFIKYTVGEYVLSLNPGDENSIYYNPAHAKFDKWMLDHFEKYESLIILFWW